MRKILITPINGVDLNVLDAAAHALRDVFNSEIAIREPLPVPQKSYNPIRKQSNATRLLQMLDGLKRGPHEYILGVIDQDLYVPAYNFVFGEADMTAGVAVIALPRLRQDFYGLGSDTGIFLLRTAKEAIHEIGHTFGIGHCTNPRCVMHFSNSLPDTDLKEPKLCVKCAAILKNSRAGRTGGGHGHY